MIPLSRGPVPPAADAFVHRGRSCCTELVDERGIGSVDVADDYVAVHAALPVSSRGYTRRMLASKMSRRSASPRAAPSTYCFVSS